MNEKLKNDLYVAFTTAFDKVNKTELKSLRDAYNAEAADTTRPELDREIAEIKIKALDPFIRFFENPKKYKHPMQG